MARSVTLEMSITSVVPLLACFGLALCAGGCKGDAPAPDAQASTATAPKGPPVESKKAVKQVSKAVDGFAPGADGNYGNIGSKAPK